MEFTEAFEELREYARIIRNEKTTSANTALRIGDMYIHIIDVMEQAYKSNDLFSLIKDDYGDKYIHTIYPISSEKSISAKGVGSQGDGGVSYDRLDTWDSYTSDKAGYVLSAALGWDLKTMIENIDLGDFDLSEYYKAVEVDELLKGKQDNIADLADIRSNAATAYGWGDHATKGYATTGQLSDFENEIKGGYVDKTSFNTYSQGIATNIGILTEGINGLSDVVSGHTTDIKAIKENYVTTNTIQTISGAKTFSSVIKANGGIELPSGATIKIAEGIISWDATNKAFKFHNPVYSTSSISAKGIGTSGGGGGGVDVDWLKFPSSIVPLTSDSYTLGSRDRYWKSLHLTNLHFNDTATIDGGSISVSSDDVNFLNDVNFDTQPTYAGNLLATIGDIDSRLSGYASNYYTKTQVHSYVAQEINTFNENLPIIPTKTSQLTNDSGFVTSSAIPSLDGYATKTWVGEQGYATVLGLMGVSGRVDLIERDYATKAYVDELALGGTEDLSNYYTKEEADNKYLFYGYDLKAFEVNTSFIISAVPEVIGNTLLTLESKTLDTPRIKFARNGVLCGYIGLNDYVPTFWDNEGIAHEIITDSLDWSKITSGKPTTLAGYGITDALPLIGGIITGALTVNGNLSGGYDGSNFWSITHEGAASFKSLSVDSFSFDNLAINGDLQINYPYYSFTFQNDDITGGLALNGTNAETSLINNLRLIQNKEAYFYKNVTFLNGLKVGNNDVILTSGGTITGALTIDGKLTAKDFEIQDSFSTTGNITSQGVGTFVNGLKVGGNDVIHSGNIGSQSVNYATSAGSADNTTKWGGFKYYNEAADWGNNKPYFKLVTIRIKSAYTNSVVSFDVSGRDKGIAHIEVYPASRASIGESFVTRVEVTGNSLFADKIRAYVIGNETDSSGNIIAKVIEVWYTKRQQGYDSVVVQNVHWGQNESVEINCNTYDALPTSSESYVDATMGSIYGSITKLSTSRTIWGQSFDGSGDVDGTLHITKKNEEGTYNEGIRINSIGGYSSVWLNTANRQGYDAGMWGITAMAGGNLRFRGGATSVSDLMNITQSGNVLIGTTTDNSKGRLQVNGSVASNSIEFVPSALAGHGGYIDFHYLGSTDDYTARIIEDSKSNIGFVANYVRFTGAATIGSTSNLANTNNVKLYVNGNGRYYHNTRYALEISSSASSALISFGGTGGSEKGQVGIGEGKTYMFNYESYRNNPNGVTGLAILNSGYFIVTKQGGVQLSASYFNINPSGNVTIGSSDLAGTNYKLFVNGTTLLNNVRINDGILTGGYDGNTVWSVNPEGAASFKSLSYDTASGKGIFIENNGAYSWDESHKIQFGINGGTISGLYDGLDTIIFLNANAVFVSGTVVQNSDMNLKDIIADVRLSLGTMANAPLVQFDWRNKVNKKHNVGTIAQYWDSCLPEVVSRTKDGTLALSYGELGVAMGISLAKDMIEMLTRVDNTESEIDKLKKRISELEKEIENLKAA